MNRAVRSFTAASVLTLALGGCGYVPPPASGTGAQRAVSTSYAAPKWHPVSAETGTIKDRERLAVLAESFPDSSSVHLRNLQAHFAAEDIAAIVREAVWLAERGYVFREGARGQLIEMAGDTATGSRLAVLFKRNAKAVTASTLVATIPAAAQLVESVAVNPRTGRLVASTVISRKLFVQNATGDWQSHSLGDVDSLSGIAFTAPGSVLWAAAANLGMTSGDTSGDDSAFTGLIQVDMEGETNVEESLRWEVARSGGGNPSDIHIASDGTVYASNPTGGDIYVVDSDGGDLQSVGKSGAASFRSPQGLTTSADRARLYISDYRYGIAIWDLRSGKLSRLASAKPMILDGIDGLWRVGNRLIGIQNGMSPMRIVAIDLSEDGLVATDLHVLEQAHPEWTEPLGGTIYQGALYYVATGQWDKFDSDGAPVADRPSIPTQVRRLPL